ncbi:hypothetical protein GGR57DRAFT_469855 [Xylariaceae sp. FL1272]|nr:hypothetical protein GGR57DRAFT_469855 [Xylariaceae sp. FL1272]
MPLYFYHLKFELYPTPSPDYRFTSQTGAILGDQVWIPHRDSSIFDTFPSHPRDTHTRQDDKAAKPRNQSFDLASTPTSKVDTGVIDCGAPRPAEHRNEGNRATLYHRPQKPRTLSLPPPQPFAAICPQTAVKDWRFGQMRIESIDLDSYEEVESMAPAATSSAAAASVGPSLGSAGKATKAKYLPLTPAKNTNIGWGIVHLYREGNESPELEITPAADSEGEADEAQTDCTIVCIPAVPSYLTPSDFLGFIGNKWRDHISHFRMVMTARMNRYLVLMKFRDSKRAQLFGQEFDGRVFNHIEPESCNVAFIRSITFDTPTAPNTSFPDLNHDPFAPSTGTDYQSLKPFPPPTPDLIELPTCPVCLERMDDTTGLLTILCQHVFHCSCLQKWKGSGCPVCRHTNHSHIGTNLHHGHSSAATTAYDPDNHYTPFGSNVTNLCTVCDCADDLWICLVCGNVGCGRYKGGHAKEHWKNTSHTFSLELDTQHVWDYAGDMWVHRLIRDKGDGKVVELPGRPREHGRRENEDVVPREKLENMGIEYTHLLTSQLESQRLYFEEMLSKAADKAAQAAAAAEKATTQATEALKELRGIKAEHEKLKTETIPSLEKDLERARTRADKSADLARKFTSSYQEEKKVSEGLMKRIEHINKESSSFTAQLDALKLENADLKDQNHDLSMFISGQEKLKELEAEGQLDEGEVQEGSVSVPEEKKRRKGKGKATK